MRVTLIHIMLVLTAACVAASSDTKVPAVSAVPAVPHLDAPSDTSSRFAGLDDVRLLANGLLQLGQSLRDFVHRTKGQINNIIQKMNLFDHSFYQLSVLASEIKEKEEELKETTVVLKANNEEIKDLSEQISSKMETILQDKGQLQSKVEGLEEKLSSLSHGLVTSDQATEIKRLRDVIHSQEQSILELLRAVTEQSEQLSNQRTKIKFLEEKFTSNMLSQDTIERTSENFNTEAPTLTPFLASSSADRDLPSDCNELFNRGKPVSGTYAIRPRGSEPFMAFCDMSKDYGATVIQQRTDGSVNFDQSWEKYENGFGDFQGEFWLGLSKIHSLSSHGNSVLHILLEDWKQNRRFIEYGFNLDGPERNYTIHLTHLSGNLTDPMTNHTGMMFSTKDRNNDKRHNTKCALEQTGGWWFNGCGDTNFNGRYFHMRPKWRSDRRKGIQWKTGLKTSYLLRFTQISVRPAASSTSTSLTLTSSETSTFL